MNNMLLPEELLREAVLKACERENAACDRFVAEREKPVFSHNFQKKIAKLKKDIKHTGSADIIKYPHKRLSPKGLRLKLILIAVIIMMFGSMTVMAVEPLRENLYQIIETLFPDHTDISFKETEDASPEKDANPQTKSFNPADFPRKLKWVPEGFGLYQENVNKTTFSLFQFFDNSNSQGKWQQIEYQQVTLDNSSGWSFTSDGTTAKEIKIGSEKGLLYKDEEGYHSIVMEKDGFAYYIGGNVEVEVLTKCLESAFENK